MSQKEKGRTLSHKIFFLKQLSPVKILSANIMSFPPLLWYKWLHLWNFDLKNLKNDSVEINAVLWGEEKRKNKGPRAPNMCMPVLFQVNSCPPSHSSFHNSNSVILYNVQKNGNCYKRSNCTWKSHEKFLEFNIQNL